ncbi:MAG: hypothetical protein OEY29_15770, partial [Gammaproteobacteria bacterium]|nr:hypothetical protein [Gammaproteobacteria bacterium]
MTDFTVVPSGDRDPESPITPELIDTLYFNPFAMFEGAVGAPKISPAAFSNNAFGLYYLGSEDDGAKIVSSSENLASGEYHYTNLTINSGQTLGVTESFDGYLLIRATGTVTLTATSIINLAGKGAEGGASQTGVGDGIPGSVGSGGGTGGGGGSSDTTQKGGPGGDSIVRTNSIVGGAQSAVGPNAVGGVGNAVSAAIQKIIQAQIGLDLYRLNGSGGGSGGRRTGAFSGGGGNGGG